ncbi:MAG: YbhB/YbcL family Raf kinase inhibitor-like protein [Alphaproteobacteria bacterium]|nr:YbhB/YbcL family Raf kinase inhibitor-like protein [Alphaproteobacteria bacterium]
MDLKSPSIEEGRRIPERYVLNGFGCEGQNISPALIWTNAPIETKSFAITLFDPDAPTGSGWWHWVLVNIPADVTSLAEGGQPSNSVSTRTDFGSPGYGGPCPPVGDVPHRYIFTVFALDIEELPLDASASGAMVGFMLNSHSLDKATLTAQFGR